MSVNDLVVPEPTEIGFRWVKTKLESVSKFTELGIMKCFPGISFKRKNKKRRLHQFVYYKRVLNNLKWTEKTLKGQKLFQTLKTFCETTREGGLEASPKHSYRKLVGSSLYMSPHT